MKASKQQVAFRRRSQKASSRGGLLRQRQTSGWTQDFWRLRNVGSDFGRALLSFWVVGRKKGKKYAYFFPFESRPPAAHTYQRTCEL